MDPISKTIPSNSLSPLKRRRFSEEITRQIMDNIFNGTFKPGDKLPSENSLREIFAVGRPVIREALRTLENSGLIAVKTGFGGGAFVKKIDSSILSTTFEGIIRLEKVSHDELTEARLTIELGMAPLIFERIEPQDILGLEKNIVQAKKGLEKRVEDLKNLRFHILLANACHNQLNIKISKALFSVLAKLLQEHKYSYKGKKKIVEEHEVLLQLLKNRNYQEFKQTLEEHIRGTRCLY